MQLNTAFLLGFLLGLASLIGAAPGVAKHDPKQHPEYKCGKHEEGCNKIVKHNLMYLQRFASDDCTGKKVGPEAKVNKFECYHFKKKPISPLSMNIELPLSKVMNHCDVTFYDGKHCHGKIVQKIYGNQSETYNSQSHCIPAPWLKSMYIGPCT